MTLQKFYEIPTVSGFEGDFVELIISELKPRVDEVYTDTFGNIIARKGRNNNRKIMFECGMDECGLMAVAIDENGNVRINSVGNFEAANKVGQEVEFMNSSKAIGILRCDKSLGEKITSDDLYIDIDANDKKHAETLVNIGDFACFKGKLIENDIIVKGNHLTDKLIPYIMANVATQANNSNVDLYFVFSAQRKLNSRGLKAVLSEISPEILITFGGVNVEKNIKQDGGAVVLAKDKSAIASEGVKNDLIAVATTHQIYVGAKDFGLTNLRVTGANCNIGGIFLPVKYKSLTFEKVMKSDIENVQNLLLQYIDSL